MCSYKKKTLKRSRRTVSPADDTAALLEKVMRLCHIPPERREGFLQWTVASLWDTYKTELMNRRIIIENEIRNLGLHFPNGTVNKDYRASVSLPVDKISDISLEGTDNLGLTFSEEAEGEFVLSGKPLKSGDFLLKLRYSTVEGEPQSEQTLAIAFNPDPRSLWRDIPSAKDIRFPKDDVAEDYLVVESPETGVTGKGMVAASVRGRSHAHEGRPRDDHFILSHSPESDWYIIAVADGAGSAPYSRQGSRIACETVAEYCGRRLENNPEFEALLHEWQENPDNHEKRTSVTRKVIDIVLRGALVAHENINKTASEVKGSAPRDFATTLMYAICKKFDFGWFIATFWVGDGAMCIFDAKNKTAKLLGTPDEGEFSGQTRFLTMSDVFQDKDVVRKRMRMAVVQDFTALILMTDGVSDPMFDSDRSLNDYEKWEEFYTRLREGFPEDDIPGVDLSGNNQDVAEGLLRWLGFWSPGNHDDRTIAMLY